jgi:hypothetical protein
MSLKRQEIIEKRKASEYYSYYIGDKEMRRKIFQYLAKYCYIFDNRDCTCPFRAQTITFKSRFGKKFDQRLKKYAEIFGFATTSGPIFDMTILPESKDMLQEIREYIAMDCLAENPAFSNK